MHAPPSALHAPTLQPYVRAVETGHPGAHPPSQATDVMLQPPSPALAPSAAAPSAPAPSLTASPALSLEASDAAPSFDASFAVASTSLFPASGDPMPSSAPPESALSPQGSAHEPFVNASRPVTAAHAPSMPPSPAVKATRKAHPTHSRYAIVDRSQRAHPRDSCVPCGKKKWPIVKRGCHSYPSADVGSPRCALARPMWGAVARPIAKDRSIEGT